MLRSRATSRPARVLGYLFVTVCAIMLAYSFFVAVWLVFWVDTTVARVWLIVTALLILTVVVVATKRILRRTDTGGYLRLALVYLAMAFLCFLGWAQAVVWY